MNKLIARTLKASRKYNVWDFSWLKVALFTFGILFGVYLYQFCLGHILFIWVLFLISSVWIWYKTFVKYM